MKTQVNGKEIKLFNKNDIGAVFTSKVAEFLSKGYIFNLSSSNGTQGEEMKADLSNDNGETVLRVYVDSKSIGFFEGDVTFIKVEKFENAKNSSTLWTGKGEVIFEKTYWCITSLYTNSIFVESEEDFNLIKDVQKERFSRKCLDTNKEELNSENAKKIALKLVKKQKGFKSTNLKEIEKIVKMKNGSKTTGYRVVLSNKKQLGFWKKN